MHMLPQYHIIGIFKPIKLNHAYERGEKKNPTTPGEFLKWIGVVILETHVEFGTCDFLWNTHPRVKYLR